MGEPEGGGDVGDDVGRPLGKQRSVAAQDVGDGASVHVLHHHEVRAALAPEVEDPDDVGMREVRGRRGLAAEALHEVGIGGVLREQHLHGDRTVEQAISGEEHVGHAATPDPAVDLVTVVEDGAVGRGHRESGQQPTDGPPRDSGRSVN